ncbi:MAG: hypothetical protein BMS9Abin05_1064 [Rhodothermia bacterium]|nr:MAG: hypothetical protein BMS9Abin05_1064 [Rhodothermia bacterium]
MTASRKHRISILVMALAVIVTFIGIAPAYAQEYKETFNAGLEAAKAKDLTAALGYFDNAADAAQAEGDAEIERRSREFVARIEYSVGIGLIKSEKYDEAISHFENGINQYPSYPKNFLARASALKKRGDIDAAMAGFVETIGVAQAASDSKTARSAEKAIREYYIFLASSALSRNGARTSSADADEALTYLETLQAIVDANSDVYYYLAEIYKVKGKFQDAVSMADQALGISRGSRTDKAKIYYVKGEALMSLGNNSDAKSAFQNAAYGSYKQSAEHFLETLGTG